IYKQAEFCSMCGPKHCPMQTKITENDIEALEEAMNSRGAAELSAVKMQEFID
ncbi:MAG: thiamine biosynthesis protein ThiC, partial [Prochlorococcus sp.]